RPCAPWIDGPILGHDRPSGDRRRRAASPDGGRAIGVGPCHPEGTMGRSVFRARPSSIPETSRTLLARVRDPGDAEAWGEFDALYRPLIRGVARNQGVSEPDVDDVVQEVFRRLVRALPAFSLD